ncbi:YuzF family protein [Thalassorhabdus alkalitolerans]|uniref:YuzF family protein n=1 Tax=Thalassorhabdus alkalitolerans TaxID=2282697 RepID=A0ABW0YSC8_9BACI
MESTPQLVTNVDPYVYQTLLSIRGSRVVIETVRGNVQGVIQNVMPEHVVVESHGSTFYVRIAQIVWVMPS